MLTLLTVAIFGAALAAAAYAMLATIVPESGRIVEVLFARPQPRFAPLTALVHAERRIAVRRWASLPAVSSGGSLRTREAA